MKRREAWYIFGYGTGLNKRNGSLIHYDEVTEGTLRFFMYFGLKYVGAFQDKTRGYTTHTFDY